MFVSVALICGLTHLNPLITDGCGIAMSQKPFSTLKACEESREKNLPAILKNLPEGAYLEGVECFQFNRGA